MRLETKSGEALVVTSLPLEVFPLADSTHPTEEGDIMCWVENSYYGQTFGIYNWTVPRSLILKYEGEIDWRPALVAQDFLPSRVDISMEGQCYSSTDKLELQHTLKTTEVTGNELKVDLELYRWQWKDKGSFKSDNYQHFNDASLDVVTSLWWGYLVGLELGKQSMYEDLRIDHPETIKQTYQEYLDESTMLG